MDYTNEEKLMLLNAIDSYINNLKSACNTLTGDEKGEVRQWLWKIEELRERLILDTIPIKIRHNNTIDGIHCAVCGCPADIDIGEWPFLDGDFSNPVCMSCLKKYKPEMEAVFSYFKEFATHGTI